LSLEDPWTIDIGHAAKADIDGRGFIEDPRYSSWIGTGPRRIPYTDGSGALSGYASAYIWDTAKNQGPDSYIKKDIFFLHQPPKKYRLEGHGGEYASYHLVEENDDAIGEWTAGMWSSAWAADNSIVTPVSSEIRPVNIAVRYFIKAR